MRNSKAVRFFDFTGGLNTKSPVTALADNEALDLQNINILPSGGFEKRNGNSVFNGTAMNSGAAVHGISYFKTAAANEFLVSICGDKVYKSDSLDGTMDDVTGAITVATGADKIWTFDTMNDLLISVGGTPGVPWKYSGTGNAAVLAGSPPNGSFGLSANKRFFIGGTAAAPSRIYWSILGNPEDWSGVGSGSQDVQQNDGDTLVGAAVLNNDHMLVFKQNSIHDLIITTSPFPLFQIYKNIGAVSKAGIVSAEGKVYFITPEPRMRATDGSSIEVFPDTIDPTWDGLNKSRLQYIQGVYYPRLRQIWWICSNGSATTNNYCIIWDLNRKCWLGHPTGYKMNVLCMAANRIAYGAAYDGKIYKLDDSTKTVDDSETSPGAINAFFRTGWKDMKEMLLAKNFPYVDLNFKTQNTGTFDFGYGFDFSSDRSIVTIDMLSAGGKFGTAVFGVDTYGGTTDKTKLTFTKGNGKFVQFLFRNNNASQAFTFNGMEIPIKFDAPTSAK